MLPEHLVVATTTDSEEVARTIATRVVEAKLGACAQVIGPITSVYRWDGAVQADTEWRVEIKTAADRVSELADLIAALHDYEVPEIIATPIATGSAAYLDWVIRETRA